MIYSIINEADETLDYSKKALARKIKVVENNLSRYVDELEVYIDKKDLSVDYICWLKAYGRNNVFTQEADGSSVESAVAKALKLLVSKVKN